MNREETTIVKDFAIVLVLWHHLLGFADRLHAVTWAPPFWFLPGAEEGLLEQHVASFGKIAVPVFLFLTGFGFQRRLPDSGIAPTRYALSKLLHLAKAHWICFAVFIPIGLWIPGSPAYQLDLKECFLNLVAWHDSLNGEWWFVKLYIQVLLFTPLAYHLVVRFPATTLLASGVTFAFAIRDPFGLATTVRTFPYEHHLEILRFAMWQLAFFMGMVFAKAAFVETVRREIASRRGAFFGAAMLLLSFLVWTALNIDGYWLSTPLLILGVPPLVRACRLEGLFALLGRHSLYIWLTHGFFCYYYCQSIVFLPRLSIAILVWLLALSLATSIALRWTERRVVDGVLAWVGRRMIPAL